MSKNLHSINRVVTAFVKLYLENQIKDVTAVNIETSSGKVHVTIHGKDILTPTELSNISRAQEVGNLVLSSQNFAEKSNYLHE